MSIDLQREQVIGVLCALGVVVLWSGFLILSRHAAARSLTPYDLTALRFGVSGVIMLPYLIRSGFKGLKAAHAIAITLTAGPGFSLCAYLGFSLAPVSHGAVLIPGVMPLFTAVLAVLIVKEPLGQGRMLSLALILSGIGFMAKDSLAYDSAGRGWGDLLFLCGSFSWAVYAVLARLWDIGPLQATASVSVLSMAGYLPIYIGFLPSKLAIAPIGEVIVQGIYQGLLSVIVAMLLFTRAVGAVGPSVTTMITAAVPGTAALAAIPVLGEPLNLLTGLGLILVTLGMMGAVFSVHPSKVESKKRMEKA